MNASLFDGELFGDLHVPLQTLEEPLAIERGVRLSVARLDQVDPLVSGNKWFKLLPNLECAARHDQKRILSFGGPWSNHIHALAWAGRRLGFETVGIIRGYATLPLTATLKDARRWGMQLEFVDHGTYRRKEQPAWLATLQESFGPCYIVPEGGASGTGVAGCSKIFSCLAAQGEVFSTAVLAVGTGATLAGLIDAPAGPAKLLGVSVLKGDRQVRHRVESLLQAKTTRTVEWEVETGCHFGGYARINNELREFIEDFYQRHGIVLDPVYTGKMMYALFRRLEQGGFAPGEHLLALHTGGLQGLRGYIADWPWAALRAAEWERAGIGRDCS